jgi:hypothetical protein
VTATLDGYGRLARIFRYLALIYRRKTTVDDYLQSHHDDHFMSFYGQYVVNPACFLVSSGVDGAKSRTNTLKELIPLAETSPQPCTIQAATFRVVPQVHL